MPASLNAHDDASIAGQNALPDEPNRVKKQSFWWFLVVGLVPMGLACACLGESLWVDELHTSWVVSGPISDLATRAAAGNQLPTYLWLLRGLVSTVGHSEWSLRLPSLISWGFAIGCSLYCLSACLSSHQGKGVTSYKLLMAVGVFLLVGWDRIQHFYATEARVYGLLQLVQLLGWLCILRLSLTVRLDDENPSRRMRRWLVAWVCVSIFALQLHLMAGLAIAWQWITGLVLGIKWKGHRSGTDGSPFAPIGTWAIAGLVVLASGLPVIQQARLVWQRREQWNSFAGDTGWHAFSTLFPVLPLCLPLLFFWIVDRCCTRGQRATKPIYSGCILFWVVAAAGPWVTAWLVTMWDLAPVFHRRYLLCCSIPLVLACCLGLTQIHRSLLRWSALCVMCISLLWTQGTIGVWRYGQWIGWHRGEDWRAAVAAIDGTAESPRVWISSGLIEASSAPPYDEGLNEYLSFPLRALYRPVGEVQPTALAGDPTQWPGQWDAAGESSRTFYVVYRGRASSLQKALRLAARGDQLPLQWESIQSFGKVAVVRARRSQASP